MFVIFSFSDGKGGPCLQKHSEAQKWIHGEKIKDGRARQVREQGCQGPHPSTPNPNTPPSPANFQKLGLCCPLMVKLPCGSDGKEPACSAGDLGSIPGWEDPLENEVATHSSNLAWKISWMEEPGRYSPWGLKELDTTERLHFHFSLCPLMEERKPLELTAGAPPTWVP